jgi:hypothetical protein
MRKNYYYQYFFIFILITLIWNFITLKYINFWELPYDLQGYLIGISQIKSDLINFSISNFKINSLDIYLNQNEIPNQHHSVILFYFMKIISLSSNEVTHQLFIGKFIINTLNIIGLYTFLTSIYKNRDLAILVSLLILLNENVNVRFDMGHISLSIYIFFLLSLANLQRFLISQKIIYAVLFNIFVFIQFDIDKQIFIFLILTVFIILILNYFFNFKKIKFHTIYLSFICIYLLLLNYNFFINLLFSDFSYEVRSIETLNKYSIKNPLEYFFNIKYSDNFINFLTNFLNEKERSSALDFNDHIKTYGLNTIEFTYYMGFLLPLILLANFKTLYKERTAVIYFFIIGLYILLSITNIFFFSFLNIFNLIFPHIRSVGRVYIFIDIFIIGLLYIVLNRYYQDKNILKIFLIYTLIVINLSFNISTKISNYVVGQKLINQNQEEIISLIKDINTDNIAILPTKNKLEENYYQYLLQTFHKKKIIFFNRKNSKLLTKIDDNSLKYLSNYNIQNIVIENEYLQDINLQNYTIKIIDNSENYSLIKLN